MKPEIHNITIPIIIDVASDGARRITPRANTTDVNECLLVIYRHPTIRQARIQFWLSLKMLVGSLARAIAGYFHHINLAHNAIRGFYINLPDEQEPDENRSFDHGR